MIKVDVVKIDQWSSSTGFLIGGLAYSFFWMDESLQRSMELSGFKRVNRNQSLMLIYIGAGMRRPSDLAKVLGISRQAVHQALQEMIANDLIALHPDDKDKRAKIIRFHEKAEPLRDAAREILIKLEQVIAERLSQKDLNNLKKSLSGDWGDIVSLELDKK